MIVLVERKQQLYRLIGTTSVVVSLAVLLVMHLPTDVRINYAAFYVLVALAVLVGAALVLDPRWLESRPYLFWPIAAGLFPAFEALAVYFSDGVNSPFFVLFYFSLFFVGMVGGHRGAIAGSLLVAVLYLAACAGRAESLHLGSILLRLAVPIASFYGICFFAAFLGNIASQEARDASRRGMRIAGLNAVNTNLSGITDLDDLLSRIPRELCHQLGFERALLYIPSGEMLYLRSSYTKREPERLEKLEEYLEKHPPSRHVNCVEAEVARTLRSEVVRDPARDPRVNPIVLEITQSRSFVAAPMVAQDQLMGVLVADYFRREHSISEEEVILLSTFASAAALAVLNCQLVVEAGRAEAFRQLDALKSDFLATVSHEFRTPLTLVKASADLLMDDISAGLNPVQRRLVETVSRNTVRLNAFVEEMLEMAQLEEGQIELECQITDLRQLVDEVARSLELLFSDKHQTLYLDLPEEPCLAEVDRHRIQQVLTNLIGNASKYTPEGGSVWARVLADQERVTVEVRDNGPGIPAEQLEHIFDKFYRVPGSTERVKGTGLGLAIARSLVELHGGEIHVSSEPREGTRFWFWLQRCATSDNIATPGRVWVAG